MHSACQVCGFCIKSTVNLQEMQNIDSMCVKGIQGGHVRERRTEIDAQESVKMAVKNDCFLQTLGHRHRLARRTFCMSANLSVGKSTHYTASVSGWKLRCPCKHQGESNREMRSLQQWLGTRSSVRGESG